MPARSDPHPKPDDKFRLDGKTYVFPSGKMGVPFEIGKAARVYQVIGENHALHALKVFFPEYRSHSNAGQAIALSKYKHLTGLAVAERHAITARDQQILTAFPQFENAILMPWVSGKSWQNYILGELPITPEQSLNLARELVSVISELEENGLAHCDLSNGNFVFSPDFTRVELVDIEEMYAKEFTTPQPLPVGSDGYAPLKIVQDGYYGPEADRHALGILVIEILCWQVEKIRKQREGTAFFASDEFGHKSQRYKLVKQCLTEVPSRDGLNLSKISELFDQVWFSRWKDPSTKQEHTSSKAMLKQCPSVADWKDALGTGSIDSHVPVLTVDMSELYFGILQPNGFGAPNLSLTLTNSGGGMLSGDIITSPWLSVNPSTKIAHQKGQKNSSISVSLKQDFPRSRQGGELRHPTGLVIQTNGGTKVLGVRYVLPQTQWVKKLITWSVSAGLILLLIGGMLALNNANISIADLFSFLSPQPTEISYALTEDSVTVPPDTPTEVSASLPILQPTPTRTPQSFPTLVKAPTSTPVKPNSSGKSASQVNANIKYTLLDGVPPLTLKFSSERSTITYVDGSQELCYESKNCTYEWNLTTQRGSHVDTKYDGIYVFVFYTPGNYDLSLKMCYLNTSTCNTDTVSIQINKP